MPLVLRLQLENLVIHLPPDVRDIRVLARVYLDLVKIERMNE